MVKITDRVIASFRKTFGTYTQLPQLEKRPNRDNAIVLFVFV